MSVVIKMLPPIGAGGSAQTGNIAGTGYRVNGAGFIDAAPTDVSLLLSLGCTFPPAGESIYGKLRRVAQRARSGVGNPHIIDPATGLPTLMANPPTITTASYANSGAVATAGFTKPYPVYVSGAVNAVYYVTGGWPYFKGQTLFGPCVTNAATGNANVANNPPLAAVGWRLNFMTDSPKFVFATTNAANCRVIVDGRYTALAQINVGGSGGATYSLVDFTSVGGRQTRKIALEFVTASGFISLYVGPTETVWAPSSSDNLRWIQNGDSLTTSSGTNVSSYDGYAFTMADMLGISDYRGAGIGGTGYFSVGTGPFYRMSEHMFDLLNYNPDIISLAGGVNDWSSGWASSAPYVASCIDQARAYSATMPIFVTGVLNSITGANAPVVAYETALAAYVASRNDPNLFFVPICTDPGGPWITGTGSSGGPANDGNRDVYYDSAGPHPPTIGHQYLGLRYAAGVLAAVAEKA